MIIAIDYDGTYSRFPNQFNLLRESFQSIGAKVYIVTARCEELTPIEEDLSAFDKIIYTNGVAKANAVRADIFIDDNPVTLTHSFVPNKPYAEPADVLHQGHKGDHIVWVLEEGKYCSYTKRVLEE